MREQFGLEWTLVRIVATIIIILLVLLDVYAFWASPPVESSISAEKDVSQERGEQVGPVGKVFGVISKIAGRRLFAYALAIVLVPILLGFILVPFVRPP